jgi:hypothetical protein
MEIRSAAHQFLQADAEQPTLKCDITGEELMALHPLQTFLCLSIDLWFHFVC